MNKRKITMLFIITTLFAMTILYSSKDLITHAAEDELPEFIYTPNYTDVSAVKYIEHGAEALGLGVSGNNSYVGRVHNICIIQTAILGKNIIRNLKENSKLPFPDFSMKGQVTFSLLNRLLIQTYLMPPF